MKVVTIEQMRALELAADEQGLSFATMMENAGRAVAHWLEARGVAGRRVTVLVGPGNNGGDGLVAARYLHRAGAAVTLYCWKRRTEHDQNWKLASDEGIPTVVYQDDPRLSRLRRLVSQSDWVLDAFLGTGVSRPIAGDLKRILGVVSRAVRRKRGANGRAAFIRPFSVVPAEASAAPSILAVDVPSGLNCDTGEVESATLRADVTVTFALPKVGLLQHPGAGHVGELVVADIGIPAELSSGITLELATPALVSEWLPERPYDAHKGTFGKAMIVAGSSNYTGAPFLAGSAALRVGAGLVTLGIAELLQPIVAAALAEATYLLLPHEMGALVPDATDTLWERLPDYDVLLVGPGLGREKKTVEFVQRLLGIGVAESRPRLGFLETASTDAAEESPLPALVIDADGLNALVDVPNWARHLGAPAVLTPHPAEMARLLGTSASEVQADRIGTARRAAQQWNVVVVLKGALTVTASPEGIVFINPFANPVLATAGTGDVLAGVIVGLMAQGLPPLRAAVVGAYLHGMAGQMVSAQLGLAGGLAGDLLPKLPLAIRCIAES